MIDYEQPDHYKIEGIDVPTIDIVRAVLGDEGFINFCYGNILKYAIRAKKKGFYFDDIEKIKVYAEWIGEINKKETESLEKYKALYQNKED